LLPQSDDAYAQLSDALSCHVFGFLSLADLYSLRLLNHSTKSLLIKFISIMRALVVNPLPSLQLLQLTSEQIQEHRSVRMMADLISQHGRQLQVIQIERPNLLPLSGQQRLVRNNQQSLQSLFFKDANSGFVFGAQKSCPNLTAIDWPFPLPKGSWITQISA